MKRRILLVALAGGLLSALALPAAGQGWPQDNRWGWQGRSGDRDRDDQASRDRDHDRYRDRRAYQDGMRDGQKDRGKKWHPRGAQWKGEDRGAYDAGYRNGFNGYTPRGGMDRDGDRDRDRDRDRGQDRDRGRDRDRGGIPDRRDDRPTGSQAYRNGYTEGLRYGQHDAQARKAFKPTDSQVFQDGTRGFNTRYGHVDDYKVDFRRGYQDGYQRGYYGR